MLTVNQGTKRFRPSHTRRATVWERLAIEGNVVRAVEQGFAVQVVGDLQEELKVPQEALLRLIDLPARTLARRKKGGYLNAVESDRVARIINALSAAERLFEGDRERAQEWMQRPNRGLNGESPLSLLSTEAGAREVLDLIGRLEHGVVA